MEEVAEFCVEVNWVSKTVVGEHLKGTAGSTVVSIGYNFFFFCCGVNKGYSVYWTVSDWKILLFNKRNPIQTG